VINSHSSARADGYDTAPTLCGGFTEIFGDYFPIESRLAEIDLTGDRCRDRPHLNLRATRFVRRIQQKLAAAKINGSGPLAHAKDSLLAKACDRLILESQLAPGLDTGLHGGALVNIVVHRSRAR
jgi:hypothetical protein